MPVNTTTMIIAVTTMFHARAVRNVTRTRADAFVRPIITRQTAAVRRTRNRTAAGWALCVMRRRFPTA